MNNSTHSSVHTRHELPTPSPLAACVTRKEQSDTLLMCVMCVMHLRANRFQKLLVDGSVKRDQRFGGSVRTASLFICLLDTVAFGYHGQRWHRGHGGAKREALVELFTVSRSPRKGCHASIGHCNDQLWA